MPRPGTPILRSVRRSRVHPWEEHHAEEHELCDRKPDPGAAKAGVGHGSMIAVQRTVGKPFDERAVLGVELGESLAEDSDREVVVAAIALQPREVGQAGGIAE